MAIVQHLVGDLFGAHIGKHSERLQVTQKGTVVMQAPLLHLEAVIVANQGVSVSAEMVGLTGLNGWSRLNRTALVARSGRHSRSSRSPPGCWCFRVTCR